MNRRFVIVGVFLGVTVLFAFIMGSPMFGGLDMHR